MSTIPHGHAPRCPRRWHHVHRHRARVRQRRRRRDAARRRPEDAPRRDRAHDQVRLRHRPPTHGPGQSERPPGLASRSRSERSSKRRSDGSAPTTSTSTSSTTRASSRSSTTSCGTSSNDCSAEGKVRELGVALGPAIGWVEEGLNAVRERPIVSLQTVFNVLEQEPGLTFAGRAPCRGRRGRPHLACPPCVRHALGEGHPRHRVPDRPTTAPTATARTCSTTSRRPSRSRSSGRTPDARSDRRRSPGILANPAFTTVLPTCVYDRGDPRSTRRRPTFRSPKTSTARLDELLARNFDSHDRYEMPMKSSAGGDHDSSIGTPTPARRTPSPAARCRMCAVRRTRLLRHFDGRSGRGRGRDEARLLPALPVEAGALRRGARRRRGRLLEVLTKRPAASRPDANASKRALPRTSASSTAIEPPSASSSAHPLATIPEFADVVDGVLASRPRR